MRNHPGYAVEVEEASLTGSMTIRQARLSDVPDILRLINDYAGQTVMLPRTELEVCESLRDFLVAVDHDRLMGCGALHFYTQHMAEMRSLAVAPENTRSGLGRKIVENLIEQGRAFGVDVIFAFTYVPGFFAKVGFHPVDRGALPLKAWKDCLRCPKFQACDEVAVAYPVTPGADVYMSALPSSRAEEEHFPLLPILAAPRVLDE